MSLRRTCLALCCLHFGNAADWPRFRGPNGAGIGDERPLPSEFGPDRNVVWKFDLPPGLSSPVIAGSNIYVTGLENGRFATIALDKASGKTVWKRFVDRRREESLHKLNHPASPSVAAGADIVVSFFPDFGLVAYTPSGVEKWRLPMGPFQNTYGMGASPILAGDRVILVCDQSKGSFAAAYSAADGKQIWRTPRPEAVSGHSTPILYGGLVIAPGSFRMDAYEVANGRIAWSVEGLPSEMKSVPVIDQGLIFIHGFNTPENDAGRLLQIPDFAAVLRAADANQDGKIAKSEAPTQHVSGVFVYLDLDGDGHLNEAEWRQYQKTMRSENALLAFRLDDRRLAWRFTRSIPQLPSPLAYRGVLYMINESGVLTTLDAATGKLHKQTRLRGEADRYYSSPVAGDGKVFIASHTGVVHVLRAGPEQELLSVNRMEDEILTTPALVDGKLYLRTRGTLYCFGSKPAGVALKQ